MWLVSNMSANIPASSAIQTPFANPQPAPSSGAHAVSPPSKASLKSWWKNFREPTSKHNNEQSVEQPAGIFGVPLRQSITYANVAISLIDGEGRSYIYGYVPIVVAKCGVYLKEKATNVEGIFRLSGSEKRIKELRTIFDSPDRYGKGLDWAGYTVHDAANVLRRYLNQLPEPIVPLDLYDRFREPLKGHTMEAVGDTEGPQLSDSFDAETAIATYQNLITEMPPLNRQLLLYILDLLAVFASKSDENRMNAQNLSAIFQPGIISHPTHDMAPKEYRLSQDVLIFLIENQDHFLIGMRGTAADEQTVNDVQNGGTPPPGTPSTPNKLKSTVTRSASNASAGADSVRKYGGVRRNLSVSSKHSRQSNGATSPASPVTITNSSIGVYRSNTVPSKRSPALSSGLLQKHSVSPSPTAALLLNSEQHSILRYPPLAGARKDDSSSPQPTTNATNVTSQEKSLGDHPLATPTRERNLAGLFQRSPTIDSERKLPNKLRKKRIPSSSNPSAQSSTQSLSQNLQAVSPGLVSAEVMQHPILESIPVDNVSIPPLSETTRAERPAQLQASGDDRAMDPERNLKPVTSPTSSLHSRSSFNDQSDVDHHDDTGVLAEPRKERSRWRLSRNRDHSQSMGSKLSPRRGLGSEIAGSNSSIGSSRPRKSFNGDHTSAGIDTIQTGAHPRSSNDSNPSAEDKKGPLGWIKNIMREKREDKAEKGGQRDGNKSPPASADHGSLAARGKSMEVKREDEAEPVPEDLTAEIVPEAPSSS